MSLTARGEGAWLSAWPLLSRAARRLVEVRLLRSLGQGVMIVDFTLYLEAAGWHAAAIGALLAAEGLVGSFMMVAIGLLSDRYGRRGFLLVYQAVVITAMAAVLLQPAVWIVAASAVALGLGRGANGAAGPFGPVEQAWLAHTVPRGLRARAFSLNSGAAFFGMGAGALVAGVLPLLSGAMGLTGPRQFLPVFVLLGALAVVNGAQLWGLSDPRAADAETEVDEKDARPARGLALDDSPAARTLRQRQNRALVSLMWVNSINAVAVGLVGPLIPYWFSVKFGVGPTEIGPIYAATFFLTSGSSVVAGEMAARLGIVRAVVLTRIAGVALMAAMPFAPVYALAASIYAARSVANRSSAGARGALGVGLVGDERRGMAASLNGVSFRLPSSIGPLVGGWMFSLGDLTLPFLIAAGLQAGFLVLYGAVLRDVESVNQSTAAAGG